MYELLVAPLYVIIISCKKNEFQSASCLEFKLVHVSAIYSCSYTIVFIAINRVDVPIIVVSLVSYM